MADIMAILKSASKKGGAKPSDEEAGEPAGTDESAEDPGQEYGDELASLLNVSDEDKDAFMTALSGYVRACSGKMGA